MKEILQSSLRHAFTGLAGLGTFLALHGWIDPAEVDKANAAGVSLGDGLQVIIAILVARLVLWVSGKMFANGKLPTADNSATLIVFMCAGSLIVGGLSGCQSANSRGWPVTIGITGPDGAVSYSSKGGLVVEAVIRAEK